MQCDAMLDISYFFVLEFCWSFLFISVLFVFSFLFPVVTQSEM